MCPRALVWLPMLLCIDVAYAFSNARPRIRARHAKASYSPSVLKERARLLRSSAPAFPSRGLRYRSESRSESADELPSPSFRRLSCKERKDAFEKAYNATVIPEKEDPCRNGTEKCVVSIAVYCHQKHCDEFYTRGIKNNIKAMRKIYPGWKLRIYTDGSLPANLRRMITSDISEEVVVKGVQGHIAGMFWRLFAANDPTVDRVSIRDSDNIVNLREKALVNEWIRSGKKYHAVRDHPQHTVPLLGGAWGVMKKKGEAVAIPKSVIEDPARQGNLSHYMAYKGGDQKFLWDSVWPQAKDDLIAHDSYLCSMFPRNVKPIPVPRRGGRDIICYPNEYKDEDDFYECDQPALAVYENMHKHLYHRAAPRECRPGDHLDWQYN